MLLQTFAFDPTPWNLATTAAAVLAVAVGVLASRKDTRGSTPLSALMVAAALWGLSNVLAASGTAPFWDRVSFLWIPITAFAWLVFALQYAGYEQHVTVPKLAVLALHPLIVGGAALANPELGLIWPEGVTAQATGPLWIAHAVYSYVVIVGATVLVVRHLFSDEGTYRMQAVLLAVGAVVPLIANAIFITTGFPGRDPTPIAFTATGVLLLYGMRSYGLADVTPVATSKVMKNLAEGIVVVNDDGQITDINDHARELFDVPDAGAGDEFAAVFEGVSHVADLASATEEFETEADVEIERDGLPGERETVRRTLAVEMTLVRDDNDAVIGRLFTFRDVTDRREQERRLELQNKQLDAFAAGITREISDPLDDVRERLGWTVQNLPEDLERQRRTLVASRQTLGDVEETIEELVSLSRKDSVVREEDMTRLSLSDAADHALYEQTGREGPTTLSVRTDDSVYADSERLYRLLGNIFENSVVHAGEDVTIEVGRIDDDGQPVGFYVSDDGPGLDVDGDPTELGTTTVEDRPGVGLAVAETDAEAHGWSLSVEDDDGVRVEVTGVSFPETRLSDRFDEFGDLGVERSESDD
jgi:signal transduction histidine kinase